MLTYDSEDGWTPGDGDTLYTIVDNRTGRTFVRPGHEFRGIGPEATIRIATRDEAETHWQSPLHKGWKVSE